MAAGNMDFMSFDDLPEVRPTIEDGEYNVRVMAKLKDSKKGGKYIGFDAIVQDGANAGYRMFNQIIAIEGEQAFQLKKAAKAVGFKPVPGLTVYEAAQGLVDFINGNIYLVRVGRKPAQEQNEDGVWVNISDNWVNQVKGFVRAK